MTPEMMKWALGAMASLSAAVIGAVVWLTVLVFRVGQKYGAVENTLEAIQKTAEKLEASHERLERIPILELKVDQVINSVAEERRRFASEWPEMREKVATLWQKVFSMAQWRKSQGQYGE